MVDDLVDAIGGACWSKVNGLRFGLFQELWAGRQQVQLEARIQELASRKIGDLELFGLGHTQLINNEDMTHVPPAPDTDKCTLRVNTVEGSGSNQLVRAVAKKIVVVAPNAVVLRAEGMPPGGTYAWSITPASETNKFTATGCDASYAATEAVKKVRVQVEYTCPDGKTVQATHPIVIAENTARK